MFQELLSIAGTRGPSNLTVFLEVAAVVAVVGLALWLVGARFSRQIVTLCGVAAGATILLCVALTGMAYAKPQWLGALPANTWAQAGILAGIVLFGAIVQWKLAPKGVVKKKAAPAPTTT